MNLIELQMAWFKSLFLRGAKKTLHLFNEDEQDIVLEIPLQLLASVGFDVFYSWGVEEMFPTWHDGNPAYVFCVNARLFSGEVKVVYNQGTDLYDIYLNDKLWLEGDFCDTFGANIDRKIESGNKAVDYDKYINDNYGINIVNLN